MATSILRDIESSLEKLKNSSTNRIQQLLPDLKKVAELLNKIMAQLRSSSGASTSASGSRPPPVSPPATTTPPRTLTRTPAPGAGGSSQPSGSRLTRRERSRGGADGEDGETVAPKRRRINPGQVRNYNSRPNRFTTQSPATTRYKVTEAAQAKGPTKENIDRVLLVTASGTTPTVNVYDDPPECLNEGEEKVVETIRAALHGAVQHQLATDHFIGRCVRKGKETADPSVSLEAYVTNLCKRAEDIKKAKQKDVVSRYVGVKFRA